MTRYRFVLGGRYRDESAVLHYAAQPLKEKFTCVQVDGRLKVYRGVANGTKLIKCVSLIA